MTGNQASMRYDEEADILYIELREGEYSHSIELEDQPFSIDPDFDSHVLLDIGKQGELLGVEVQAASQLHPENLHVVESSWGVPLHLLATFARNMTLSPA